MRMDERVELGEGVPSRGATDDARDAAYRDGVVGATDPAREADDGALAGSGGVGGSIDHPKSAVRIDASEGSAREGTTHDADSWVGVLGSSSRLVEDGNDTELMIVTNDCT